MGRDGPLSLIKIVHHKGDVLGDELTVDEWRVTVNFKEERDPGQKVCSRRETLGPCPAGALCGGVICSVSLRLSERTLPRCLPLAYQYLYPSAPSSQPHYVSLHRVRLHTSLAHVSTC
jgi:hypothetical protein